VLVWRMVVVTTVVEVPVPSVYVRTTDSDAELAAVAAGPLLNTSVLRGIGETVAVITPAGTSVAVPAENEE